MPSKYLTKRLILGIHRDQINSFGGSHGIRDEGLLDSALEQPKATFGGKALHPSIFDQAAAYLFHLVNDHAFVDGNKRIALAAADTFLRLNGHRLTLPDKKLYRLVIDSSTGMLNKDSLAKILRENSRSKEEAD